MELKKEGARGTVQARTEKKNKEKKTNKKKKGGGEGMYLKKQLPSIGTSTVW
jgi:tRNA G37 N-methylase TrmD